MIGHCGKPIEIRQDWTWKDTVIKADQDCHVIGRENAARSFFLHEAIEAIITSISDYISNQKSFKLGTDYVCQNETSSIN